MSTEMLFRVVCAYLFLIGGTGFVIAVLIRFFISVMEAASEEVSQ